VRQSLNRGGQARIDCHVRYRLSHAPHEDYCDDRTGEQ
jgi:hypothetical protein